MTADDIAAHLAAVQGESWESPLGIVIYRLQEHIHAPEIDPRTGHAVGCGCGRCHKQGWEYSGGSFAEYLRAED